MTEQELRLACLEMAMKKYSGGPEQIIREAEILMGYAQNGDLPEATIRHYTNKGACDALLDVAKRGHFRIDNIMYAVTGSPVDEN